VRHFTPEEANAALVHVRPLVEQMVAHRAAMRLAEEHQEELQARVSGNGGGIPPEELARAAETLEQEAAAVARCVDAIQERGALVKDLDTGLVDFPARRAGEEVLLCWRLGEDEIGFWHTLDGGFGGRRPLPL
jgi:hypothetical protein